MYAIVAWLSRISGPTRRRDAHETGYEIMYLPARRLILAPCVFRGATDRNLFTAQMSGSAALVGRPITNGHQTEDMAL